MKDSHPVPSRLLGSRAVALLCLCAPFSCHRSLAASNGPQRGSDAAATGEGGGVAAGRPGAWRVDCGSKPRKISPLIYGVGREPNAKPGWWTMGATARRWGGNTTSRFNWMIGDTWNTGSDWFFENVRGPSLATFLSEDAAHGLRTALTVPMIGWVAKDATSSSFPVALFGPQEKVDGTDRAAGNGKSAAGAEIPPGPPERTSVRMTPELVGHWIQSLRKQEHARAPRSIPIVILDNEPSLWSSTHRDVHPEPLGYDELAERSIAYARAVRSADPDVQIAGPAEWGWSGYLYSARDTKAGVLLRPDRRLHGDEPLVPWYLARMKAESEKTGARLLDLLDLHFYPQGARVYSDDVDVETAALRIRQTRGLWDPAYVDESWIKEPVRLLPRMREWVDRVYPGTGLMIGEWSFGAEGHMSGALATAEALGRFAEYGVDAAFYWSQPAPDSATAYAFRAYRDFDGHGARFEDYSVPARAPEGGSLFASRDEAGRRLVLVALNASPQSPLSADVELAGCGAAAQVSATRFVGDPRGFVHADVSIDAGGVEASLPPYSITVIDVRLVEAIRVAVGP